MDVDFKVSVIVPVYNAFEYLTTAVESAVSLSEVGEILLIEDNSKDRSLDLCKELSGKYEKVVLLMHPDGQNHGAGASRNLGIRNAKFDIIAFLDADDYYLSNRFAKDKEILQADIQVDGVYNATGIKYYSEEARAKFLDSGYKYQEFLTLTESVPYDELLLVMLNRHGKTTGSFSTDAITVRKRIFEQSGMFSEVLELGQDSHLWFRMAALCKLASGELEEAVAIRGVHENNRMTDLDRQRVYLDIWWEDLYKWFGKNRNRIKHRAAFQIAYFHFRVKNGFTGKTRRRFFLFVVGRPSVILSKYGYFDILLLGFYKNAGLVKRLVSFKNKVLGNNRREGDR